MVLTRVYESCQEEGRDSNQQQHHHQRDPAEAGDKGETVTTIHNVHEGNSEPDTNVDNIDQENNENNENEIKKTYTRAKTRSRSSGGTSAEDTNITTRKKRNEPLDPSVTDRLLECYGLLGIQDNRAFCKTDMQKLNTIEKLKNLLPELRRYYTPCKARVYLEQELSERRCITVLKQMLRPLGKTLLSRERNVAGRKTVYYQVIDQHSVNKLYHMTKHSALNHEDEIVWVSFDNGST